MSPTAERRCVIARVHSRYEFAIVYVYLVSLLEELTEHHMLFWFLPVNASSAGGRGRAFTPRSKEVYVKKPFS